MDTYKTEELALAAYLLAIGFECVGLLENDINDNLFFVFNYTEQLPQAVTLFLTRGDSVEAYTYYRALKILKSLIYEHKKNGRDIS